MGKGGSGGGGKTEFVWNDEIKPYWQELLGRANEDSKQRYLPTPQRTANIDPFQVQAIQYLTQTMTDGNSNPSYYKGDLNGNGQTDRDEYGGLINTTRTGIEEVLEGKYLGEGAQNPNGNPYMGLTTASLNPYIGGNQYADMNTSTDRNVFAGDSPYARDLMQRGMEDITSAYEQGTSADTTRMFNMAGAFGGSAHQKAVANNEAALGKNLGMFANNFLQGQFDRSANLEDSFLQRDIATQQANKTAAMGAKEAELGRGFQNFSAGLDRGMTGWEGERNRMMAAMPLGQNEQGLAYQRIGGVMGAGDFRRGVQQEMNNEYVNNWTDQRNYNKNQDAWLAGILSGAQGGLPPSQMTTAMGGSNVANGLGAALAAYGMFGSR